MPNKEIILSSSIKKNNELRGQDKVIHISNLLNCDTYINAIGGMDLYSRESFNNSGIELLFLKKHEVQYRQYDNEFVDNLSIIDLLMFNSDEDIKNMLCRYDLI